MMNYVHRMVACSGLLVLSVSCSTWVRTDGPGPGGSGGAASGGSAGSAGTGGIAQGGGGVGGEAQGGGGSGGEAQGGGGSGGSSTCGLSGPKASWSQALGTGSGSFGRPLVDSTGKLFLTGIFGGSISFGGTTLNGNAGNPTMFIAKLDELGDTVWARSVAGMGEQVGGGRTLDKAGHLWIAGGFYDKIDFGGNPLTTNGAFTGFLAKLDAATGNHVASKVFGEGIGGLATDPAGNLYVYGYFDQTIDLGGGPLVSAGGYDFFVAKLDAAGNHLWSKRFGDAKHQITITGDIDAMGNLWLAGGMDGNVDFGGGPLNAPVTSAFVAKLDPSGNHIASKTFGSGWVEQIRIGGDGNIVLNGGGDYIDFGNGPLPGFNFIAKLDAQGNYMWSRNFGLIMADRIFDIGVDANGNIVAAGMVQSSTDLAGCPKSGQFSHFLWKFAADGSHLWTNAYGDSVNAEMATFDNLGGVLLSGRFNGMVDFGAGPLNGGPGSGFIARFPP